MFKQQKSEYFGPNPHDKSRSAFDELLPLNFVLPLGNPGYQFMFRSLI
jgi:hypothetical protein